MSDRLKTDLLEQAGARLHNVLLFDTSGSMAGLMSDVNSGLRGLCKALTQHPLTREQARLSLVTFGETVTEQHGFLRPDGVPEYELTANGGTPMGEALGHALSLLDRAVRDDREAGISVMRPCLWLVTDGLPTDSWESAAAAVSGAEAQRKLSVFAFGTDGADFSMLSKVSTKRPPLRLSEARFEELFEFISSSVQSIASSTDGQASLPPIQSFGISTELP